MTWGNIKWKSEVSGRGEVTWTDEVFIVARKNGAYEYVLLPDGNKKYTIDEYMEMFLMN